MAETRSAAQNARLANDSMPMPQMVQPPEEISAAYTDAQTVRPPEEQDPLVRLIDDDPEVLDSLAAALRGAGWDVVCYTSIEAWRSQDDVRRPGCMVVDMRLPGEDGLGLLSSRDSEGWPLPIILISGQADIDSAVEAMKRGALDLLQKPFPMEDLLGRVRDAVKRDGSLRRREARRDEVQGALARLTPREREVLGLLVEGNTLKEVAFQLTISPKTAQIHRASILKKFGQGTIVQVARQCLTLPEFWKQG